MQRDRRRLFGHLLLQRRRQDLVLQLERSAAHRHAHSRGDEADGRPVRRGRGSGGRLRLEGQRLFRGSRVRPRLAPQHHRRQPRDVRRRRSSLLGTSHVHRADERAVAHRRQGMDHGRHQREQPIQGSRLRDVHALHFQPGSGLLRAVADHGGIFDGRRPDFQRAADRRFARPLRARFAAGGGHGRSRVRVLRRVRQQDAVP